MCPIWLPDQVVEQPVLRERRKLILERRKLERRFLREVRHFMIGYCETSAKPWLELFLCPGSPGLQCMIMHSSGHLQCLESCAGWQLLHHLGMQIFAWNSTERIH